MQRPDLLYNSWFVKKLLGKLPLKKKIRNKVVLSKAFSRLRIERKLQGANLLRFCAHAVKPHFWVDIYQRGKKEFKIPRKLHTFQQYKKSMRWIANAIKERPEKRLEDKIFFELLDLMDRKSKVYFWKKNMEGFAYKYKHNVFLEL
jgi:ribosomal protein S7